MSYRGQSPLTLAGAGLKLFISLPLLCRFWVASADTPAMPTLEEMVASIEAGRHNNNFFDGEGIFGSASTEQHHVGMCILDKASAIISEDARTFLNDLQVDVAACCTKSNKGWCMGRLKTAYSKLHELSKPPAPKTEKADAELASVTGHFLSAARELLAGAKVSDSAKQLLSKCVDFPGKPCEMKELSSLRGEI
mmetsp:Transcript_14493/g.29429  ORF Transcript_14493/g.29429 Transcript_14493/m.29429 type:complete len:194 (-) Transcript_14493:81-662(-)|eukprot:CAMPEP_0113821078 /NCGR_PEP_ID=MMETSP0328-20130328/1558_1 /TAXON_ID=39455 /ORGANISM="Alexandrium minutum" /LENGTH=193 /DNA_ID=CAMNT_0000789009 /DNA_START=74 /DNA_END=655 /DNA_ORIENTATION=+ /assembly_acc=CAM_ASM_000350